MEENEGVDACHEPTHEEEPSKNGELPPAPPEKESWPTHGWPTPDEDFVRFMADG